MATRLLFSTELYIKKGNYLDTEFQEEARFIYVPSIDNSTRHTDLDHHPLTFSVHGGVISLARGNIIFCRNLPFLPTLPFLEHLAKFRLKFSYFGTHPKSHQKKKTAA